jgi:hypothetical protein
MNNGQRPQRRAGKDSALLYNMALCHRRAENAKRALEPHQQYLAEVPDTAKRAVPNASPSPSFLRA